MSDSTDKAVEKLTDHVEQLIKAAQKVAPHAWETMVRQVVLVNSLMVAAWVLTVAGALLLTKQTMCLYVLKGDERYGRSDSLDAINVTCGIAAAALALTAFLMAIMGGPYVVAALINPEYVAGEQLLRVLQ